MGVDVRVGGVTEWDASGLSVTEDATPLDPSDRFGGAGAITFSVPADGARSMLYRVVDITDGVRGTTQGVVRSVSGGRLTATVQALSRTVALVANRTAQPHVGTLESCLTYYFSLCGVTSGFVIDESIADIPVVVPGWFDDVHRKIGDFCAAYQVELSLVSDNIVVRPPRTVRASRVRESSFSWALDGSRLAKSVEAWYYAPTQISDALVVGTEQNIISNVGAGDVQEFDIELSASLSSVGQPAPLDSVAFDEDSASVYSVLDQFDEPVLAADWVAAGGRVSVEIGEDTRSVRVTVVGAQLHSRAPFRLAGVTDTGDEFSTLRIVGSGVAFERGKHSLPACTDDRAAQEVGAELDNIFLSSWGHAHAVLRLSARRHGSAVKRIVGAAQGINRAGEQNSYKYPTIAEWNALYASGDLISDWNTAFEGEPIAEWNAQWLALTADQFENQAYGNVAGARMFEDHDFYRIRSATITQSGVEYQAEVDTIFADVNTVNEGYTIAEWNALWAGRPITEFNLRPLTPIG